MPDPRQAFACVATVAIVALGLASCSAPPDPDAALKEAEARLQANDVAGAEQVLREALADAPEDPRFRIALARTDLAAGNPTAAEGSLQRALDLGADKGEVGGYLVQAMLAQGAPARAVEYIGDLQQWPRERQPMMAVLKAEAELAQTNYDARALTQHFADAFRLLDAADKDGASTDIAWAERRLADLGARHAIVGAAREHAACVRDPKAAELSPLAEPEPIDPNRRVLKVGPNHALKRPSDAARVARDGDVIEIEAGRYVGDVAFWPQSSLLLRGVNGRPHLDSQGRTVREEGIWSFRGNDIVVENMEFSGARARHRNGSGIRFFGRNLTIRDSYFHHNEDGVLTWNNPDGDILIERSVFDRNGYGDGLSHNIYIGHIRSFTLRFSHSHDSISGHEVKSRAQTNHILNNRLTDENDGSSSYLIDLPDGGDGYVFGNILEKGARSENPHAISFAAETPDVAQGSLHVVNNNFYSRHVNAIFVGNRSRLPVVVMNNVLGGAPSILLNGPGRESGNYRQARPGLIDPAAYDFRLTPESVLIDAGEDPGKVGQTSLWPEFEYVHPAAGRKRQRVGPIDIGAYEFCGW